LDTLCYEQFAATGHGEIQPAERSARQKMQQAAADKRRLAAEQQRRRANEQAQKELSTFRPY